jgi:transposase-like protein
MSVRTRKHFSGPFKAKVALEAIRAVKTVHEIAQEYGVHPTQVGLLPTRRRVWSGCIPRSGG